MQRFCQTLCVSGADSSKPGKALTSKTLTFAFLVCFCVFLMPMRKENVGDVAVEKSLKVFLAATSGGGSLTFFLFLMVDLLAANTIGC